MEVRRLKTRISLDWEGKKQQDDHAVALATLSFHQKLKMKHDGSVIL